MQSHPRVRHPYAELSDRLADKVGGAFGSMSSFWTMVSVYVAWMALSDLGIWFFAYDRYPHPFLLFCSNFVQLLALPILGVIGNRADRMRNLKADADHEAQLHIAQVVETIQGDVATIKKLVAMEPTSG